MYDADEHKAPTNTVAENPMDLSLELGFIRYLASTDRLSDSDRNRLVAAAEKIQSVSQKQKKQIEKYRRAWLLNMRDGSTVYWEDPLGVESGYYSLDLSNSEWECHHDTVSNIEDMEFVITAPFDSEFEQSVPATELFPDPN